MRTKSAGRIGLRARRAVIRSWRPEVSPDITLRKGGTFAQFAMRPRKRHKVSRWALLWYSGPFATRRRASFATIARPLAQLRSVE